MTIKVFFSHSTKDFSWIEPIVAQVNAMGLRGYVYEHDSQPGRPIAPKIKSAITRSNIVVVFLTMNSHDAPYVQQEIGYAQSKDKVIVPFVEDGVPERSLAMLEGIERINFDPQHPQIAIDQLWAYLSRFTLGMLGYAGCDEYGFEDDGEQEAPPQASYQFTPPLLTMSVNIDRKTAITILGFALMFALLGVAAYALIQQSGASDSGAGSS